MILRNWLAGMFPVRGVRGSGRRRRGWRTSCEMLERRELLTANLDFAISLGGTGFDSADAIAIDNAGNVYVAGGFQDTVDFDPGSGTTELTETGSFKDLYSAIDA